MDKAPVWPVTKKTNARRHDGSAGGRRWAAFPEEGFNDFDACVVLQGPQGLRHGAGDWEWGRVEGRRW